MDDVFRWDLEGYDKAYIEDLLDGFLDGAIGYGRKMIEIRMRKIMLDHLEIELTGAGAFYKGVPIKICDTGFDGTLEVILAPIQ